MNKLPNLKYIIENECFIICPLLSTDRFISYCSDRRIRTSKKQLEQFEKLGIFYPVARVRYPKIKIKIEYVDDNHFRRLGILKDREEWSGDIKEEYSYTVFEFGKEYAKSWLEEGLLWEPLSRSFQPWETFTDKEGYTQVENFYSIFQCYTLYELIQFTRMELRAEWWVSYNEDDIKKITSNISNWAGRMISSHQKTGMKGEAAASICQIISNRYFPVTQSDRRTITLSTPSHYRDWDWYDYCRNWDANAVFADIDMSSDELKKLHENFSLRAKFGDPLGQWYELVSFVSVRQKEKLKGDALLAQTSYSMEHMMRLFYEDLTGEKLHPPDESVTWKNEKFYGEGVTENELRYLEFLTNQYNLNPRPRLILIVEGDGEEDQIPRLAKELLGHSFPRLGIEVMNIQGVGSFTGKKNVDRYGALERFIDDYHCRQTIVFVVLDKEGRVPEIKKRLIHAHSKRYPKRKVTKEGYIHVWGKNIEFDNFSYDEIACAMTKLCENRSQFLAEEVEDCKNRFEKKEGDPLSKLYKEKLDYDLPKPALLKILFDFIISNSKNEFDANRKAKRPVAKLIQNVVDLAAKNYQPVTQDIWRKNQESGFFGDTIS